MKNIQVIDGAMNCTFSIFQATDREFRSIFPGRGQDIEFAESFVRRVGSKRAWAILAPIWERPIAKKDIRGLHGTLFYDFQSRRRCFPKSKREKDWDWSSLNEAQRELYRKRRRKPSPLAGEGRMRGRAR